MGKIATIAEMQKVPCKDNGEELILFEKGCYRRTDTGINAVFVRESVYKKLQNIKMQLPRDLELVVVEGYRPLAIQEKYFLKEFAKGLQENPSLELEALMETTHQFIALPSLAGHPTGGAVDVTLAYKGVEVDMGGGIADFSNPDLLPTDSTFITPTQAKWRKILHDLMVNEGFAPFYGEWWHFSYGDPEWAVLYGMRESVYLHAGFYNLTS